MSGHMKAGWAGCGYHAASLEQIALWDIERDFLLQFPIQLIYISTFTVAKFALLGSAVGGIWQYGDIGDERRKLRMMDEAAVDRYDGRPCCL